MHSAQAGSNAVRGRAGSNDAGSNAGAKRRSTVEPGSMLAQMPSAGEPAQGWLKSRRRIRAGSRLVQMNAGEESGEEPAQGCLKSLPARIREGAGSRLAQMNAGEESGEEPAQDWLKCWLKILDRST